MTAQQLVALAIALSNHADAAIAASTNREGAAVEAWEIFAGVLYAASDVCIALITDDEAPNKDQSNGQ